MTTHRFPIGTKFITSQKVRNRLVTTSHVVTDHLTTTNAAGEVVKIRYVATHDFCGQQVANHDVLDTTIARGLTEQVAA